MCSILEILRTFAVKYVFSLINKINKLMKKNFLKVFGMAVFCLPMMFASCGNVDNPLETIGTGGEENPFVSVLAGALDDGATVTIDLEACLAGQNATATATFEKDGNNFTLQDCTGTAMQVITTQLINAQAITQDQAATLSAAQILALGGLKIDFKYDLAKNQLKAIMEAKKDQDTYYPISIIVFDLSNDSYSQYTYPYNKGYFILTGISVKGDSKIDLISNDYEEKAIINYVPYVQQVVAPLSTRGYDLTPYACVFYKDGETWADVNERYEEVAGNALLKGSDNLNDVAYFFEQSFFPDYNMTYYGEGEVKYKDQVGYYDNEAFEGKYIMDSSAE